MSVSSDSSTMKNKNNLLSLCELALYLENFIRENPDAVQLDGSKRRVSSQRTIVRFRFFNNGVSFKFDLRGDTKAESIHKFISLFKSHPENTLVLVQKNDEKCYLRLAGEDGVNGWYCYGKIDKITNNSILKAA